MSYNCFMMGKVEKCTFEINEGGHGYFAAMVLFKKGPSLCSGLRFVSLGFSK